MHKNMLAAVLAVLFLVGGCTTVVHPVRPGPHPKRVWVPGHHTVRGVWVPGHWRVAR